jgi:hypothetical protein
MARILAGAILFSALPGCAWWPHAKASPVVGTWANRIGTVWTIKEDGTFDVDLTRDGKRDTWGSYTVEGDAMTINDLNPKMSKTCPGPGVYRFQRNGAELTFTLVSDACKLRKANILLGWRLRK